MAKECIEIEERVRKAILAQANISLARLGISEPLVEVSQTEYGYYFKTMPIKQFPMMFKEVIVEGWMRDFNAKEGDSCYVPGYRYIIFDLHYQYSTFSSGHNGTDLGFMSFHAKEDIPEKLRDDDMGYYVRKVQGLTI